MEARNPRLLPDLRGADTLLVGSDYSGDAQESRYLVYSFLVTTLDAWALWEPKRLSIRERYLSDGRRMSFKRLGDRQRQDALVPLLDAANSLEGLSFSLMMDKRCESPFDSPPLDVSSPAFSHFSQWKPRVLERAFLISHVLALLVSGLAAPGQNVLWFTDEDSIAASDQRVRELADLSARIASLYLTFDLGHVRCGTARCDDGTRQLEDVLAIPDLIAGSLAEQRKVGASGHPDLPGVFWLSSPGFSRKARLITGWFSDSRQPLRRLLCTADPKPAGGNRVGWYHFHDDLEWAEPADAADGELG